MLVVYLLQIQRIALDTVETKTAAVRTYRCGKVFAKPLAASFGSIGVKVAQGPKGRDHSEPVRSHAENFLDFHVDFC